MSRLAGVCALLLLAACLPAWTQELRIAADVQRPETYAPDRLATLSTGDVQAAREGSATTTDTGPGLWPLIEVAKPVDGPAKDVHLQHGLLARGADGYAVALPLAELDPSFTGKQVIIALKQDAAALAAPRLDVPGDRRAGQDVRDLVAIEIH